MFLLPTLTNMQIRSAAALLIAAVVIAGGPTARARQQTTASRLVLATVTDAQNRVLADLGPDDFVVSENGQMREVVAVFTADYPVIVLVDNSAEARSDFDAIRSAVNRFLSRVGERFVAVGTLANPPALLTSLEDERSVVLTRLDRMTAGPSSVLMPIEAVALAVQAVRENGSPFSAVVVVSAHSIDAAQPQNIRLLPDIFESGAIVHVLSRTSPATAPRGRAYAPRLQGDLLRDLADQTRGYFTPVFSAPSYSFALSNLADRLGTEVMVEYIAPPGPQPSGEVQIGVRIPGAHLRALRVSKSVE
jgi:von Willebrand factor type A domain